MPTFINITVGGNSLVDKAKAQQQAARQAKLEADNRSNVEKTAIAQRNLAQAQVITSVTGNQLPIGSPLAKERRQDEPAANRQQVFKPFFVLTNFNGFVADNFMLELTKTSNAQTYLFSGVADFSIPEVSVYVWSNFAINESQFRASKGGSSVHLDIENEAPSAIIYKQFYPLPSFTAKAAELFELELINVQVNSGLSNLGRWYAGDLSLEDFNDSNWDPDSGQNQSIPFFWPPVPI